MTFGKYRDRFWRKLAWLLPRPLAYWAYIRVVAFATSGEYASTEVPTLTAMEALKRYAEDGKTDAVRAD